MTKEFEKPLRLTSPLTTGQKVKDAQWLLSGHNRFDGLATYKDGKIDGQYGSVTAQAAARAKFWLGYPAGSCTPIFGQTLYEYLRVKDWRPLPADYRTRRAARIKAATLTTGQKALAEARKHLGYTESPWGSNHTIFGMWYGLDYQPWCAIFESWCFAHTGHPRFRYSYVPNIYDDARNGRNGLRLVFTPQAGDIALFDLHGERLAHTAFVKTPPTGGTFVDLGGNTGPTNISNGGAVMEQVRPTSMIHAWVRVL